MSIITIIVLVIILTGIIIYQIVKRYILNSLIKALHNRNYEHAIQLSNKSLSNKVLSESVCDLFRLKAFAGLKDEVKFKTEIDKALEKKYPLEKEKEFLELYFHKFLLDNDEKYANKFLDKIELLQDTKFTRYNKQAFEVIINKRTDLLDEMIDEIETGGYSGFPLGIVVYMIAMQYLYLNDKENARSYFYNSLTCFHPRSMYALSAKEHVDRLTKELGDEELGY